MPLIEVNGIHLNFEEHGSGEPVVMVMGTGASGRVWNLHQVSALTLAGYRIIIFDNRGIPPTDICAEGFTIGDMAADIAGLIQFLDIAPCRIVGFSLGAFIVQELMLSSPSLIKQAVLVATRGRTDALRAALSAAEIELCDSNTEVPARYLACVRATQCLSPRTLNNEGMVQEWLEVFELYHSRSPGIRAQLQLDIIKNQLNSYRSIRVPCLVIAFQHDLLTPPHMCREVADHIRGSIYKEIPACGHYGYMEDPVAVNSAIIKFFREST